MSERTFTPHEATFLHHAAPALAAKVAPHAGIESAPHKKPAPEHIRQFAGRVTHLLEKGPATAERVWHRAVEALVIDKSDIPLSYWRAQDRHAQEEDDTAGAIYTQDNSDRAAAIQATQRESATRWAAYLQESSLYPDWFKLYAWQGMSEMSAYIAAKGVHSKRRPGDVAPYPRLVPAALAKVYTAVRPHLQDIKDGVDPALLKQEDPEQYRQYIERKKLAFSNSFRNLYDHFLNESFDAYVVPTPERAEDVNGVWIEYLPGQHEQVAEASQGTPWCIADPGFADDYLGPDTSTNHAKFAMFHLMGTTGRISDTACISLRFDSAGDIVEISGLLNNDRQDIAKPLAPTIRRKINELTTSGVKFKGDEAKFTLLELDYYESVGQTDTLEYAKLLSGIDLRYGAYAEWRGNPEIAQRLAAHQADVQTALAATYDQHTIELVMMDHETILAQLSDLLRNGYDPRIILPRLSHYDAIEHLAALNDSGANLSVREIITDVMQNKPLGGIAAQELLTHVNDKEEAMMIIERLDLSDQRTGSADAAFFTKNNYTLLRHLGLSVDQLVPHLAAETTEKNFGRLMNHGGTVDIVAASTSPAWRYDNRSKLLNLGISPAVLLRKQTYHNTTAIINSCLGASCPVSDILPYISLDHIAMFRGKFLAHGASEADIAKRLAGETAL